jgi:hypothetical protein
MTFVNVFTEEQGRFFLATQPEVVKSLSKEPGYKEWFAILANTAGEGYVETLEADGKFAINGEEVSFATLSFMALSAMALTGFGVNRNAESQPNIFGTVIEAKEVIKSITLASDYHLFDSELPQPYAGLRMFVEVLLEGKTALEAKAELGEKFAELKAAGDAIRKAKALASAVKK